jgi:hypothetical protein
MSACGAASAGAANLQNAIRPAVELSFSARSDNSCGLWTGFSGRILLFSIHAGISAIPSQKLAGHRRN